MSRYYKITLTFAAIAVVWVIGYTIYYKSGSPSDLTPAPVKAITEKA